MTAKTINRTAILKSIGEDCSFLLDLVESLRDDIEGMTLSQKFEAIRREKEESPLDRRSVRNLSKHGASEKREETWQTKTHRGGRRAGCRFFCAQRKTPVATTLSQLAA